MNELSIKRPESMLRICQMLIGLLIWGVIAYVIIFFVLNTPIEELSIKLPEPTPAESQDKTQEINSPNVRPAAVANPATSWQESVSLARGWYVQVGSYHSKVQAEVERLKYARLQEPIEIEVDEDGLTHIFLGPYSQQGNAEQVKKRVARELNGRHATVHHFGDVVGLEKTVDKQLSTEKTATPVASNEPSPPPSPTKPKEPRTTASGTWYVQIGAFKNIENARALSKEAQGRDYPIRIEHSTEGYIRVLLGPYPTQDAATQAIPKISKVLTLGTVLVREIAG